MIRKELFLSLAISTYLGIFSLQAISSSISKHASFAPPCAGPQRLAIPAEIQARGLQRLEPVNLTVEVDAFYSWSAWRIKILSNASIITSGILKSGSKGSENNI